MPNCIPDPHAVQIYNITHQPPPHTATDIVTKCPLPITKPSPTPTKPTTRPNQSYYQCIGSKASRLRDFH